MNDKRKENGKHIIMRCAATTHARRWSGNMKIELMREVKKKKKKKKVHWRRTAEFATNQTSRNKPPSLWRGVMVMENFRAIELREGLIASRSPILPCDKLDNVGLDSRQEDSD